MSFVAWSDSLSVNIVEIDTQHKKLFQLIGDLNQAMRAGKGKDVLGDVLKKLLDYTVYHFALEEKYFAQYGYSDTIPHKKEHTDFVGKVTDFQKKFENGKMMISIEIMAFLNDWLIEHINGTDKKYAPFFHGKGLK